MPPRFPKADPSRALKGAETLITTCLGLKANHELLIVTDEFHSDEVTCMFTAAKTLEVRAAAIIVPLYDQRTFHEGDMLHETIREAVLKCSGLAVITEYSQETTPFRMKTLQYVSEYNKQCRSASMPGVRLEHFHYIDTDYAALVKDCSDLAELLLRTDTIGIVTGLSGAKHTLSVDIAAQRPRTSVGLPDKGEWANVPSGETFVLPGPGAANGIIAIDGSLPGIPLNGKEVTFQVEDSKIASINSQSSDLAERSRRLFFSDYERRVERSSNSTMLSEVGFGANRALTKFHGIPMLDEKNYGTVHVAFGQNSALGGSIHGAAHLDLVVRNAIVYLDGLREPLLKDHKYRMAPRDVRPSWRVVRGDAPFDRVVTLTGVDCRVDKESGALLLKWYPPRGNGRETRVGDDETSVIAGTIYSLMPRQPDSGMKMSDLVKRARRRGLTAAQIEGTIRVMTSYKTVKFVD